MDRGPLRVVGNFSDGPRRVPLSRQGRILLASAPAESSEAAVVLPPASVAVLTG
jgi:hypothetical protein